MMMGESGVHVPPWLVFEEVLGVAGYGLPVNTDAAISALHRYLPSNDDSDEDDVTADAYTCDEFRIYEFKIRRCARGRSHDWTECPYAHPGEKARRRDPRQHHYSGTPCPDFRKGNCKRGDACEFAHGVFECWLHPARYRTQPCKDGTSCRRRVCFFAHTPEQLRVLPQPAAPESYDGSPLRRHSLEAYFPKGLLSSSPRSTLSLPSESPPVSPSEGTVRRASWPVNEVVASMRQLQLGKVRQMPSASWGVGVGGSWGGGGGSMFCSPRATGFCSLPATPTAAAGCMEAEERVESGRALRAKMFQRLSKESGLEEENPPDVGWVSDLVK